MPATHIKTIGKLAKKRLKRINIWYEKSNLERLSRPQGKLGRGSLLYDRLRWWMS